MVFAAACLRQFWVLPRIADERRVEGFALLGALAVLAVVLGAPIGEEWLGLLVYLSVAATLALPMCFAIAGVAAAASAVLAMVRRFDPLILRTLMFGDRGR